MNIHTFEAVRNFRDCGGFRVRDGRMFQTGLLYRSGHFPNATDRDLATFQALGIAAVVDLRRPAEREHSPCRRWPGFDPACLIEHEGISEIELPPHLQAFANAGTDVEETAAAMRQIYHDMPFDPMISELYRQYFVALGNAKGPLLVHCAAGKDRTGLAVALTQHLLGVSQDDILAHFLETNRTALLDKTVIQNVRENFWQDGRPVCDEAIHIVLTVVPEYLDIAYAAIKERSGSVDAYLAGALGVTPAMREAIAGRLLR